MLVGVARLDHGHGSKVFQRNWTLIDHMQQLITFIYSIQKENSYQVSSFASVVEMLHIIWCAKYNLIFQQSPFWVEMWPFQMKLLSETQLCYQEKNLPGDSIIKFYFDSIYTNKCSCNIEYKKWLNSSAKANVIAKP